MLFCPCSPVNAVPVQGNQQNLQGLLDVLTDQKTNKESIAQVAKLVKQQQDNDKAEAQFFGKFLRHAVSIYVNKQQDDDNGNQAEAQFFGKLLKNVARKYMLLNTVYMPMCNKIMVRI